jgi:hypothetical protein
LQAELPEGRQGDIQEVILGARTLAESGDQQGCMNVVAELKELAETVEQGGQQQAQTGQQQPEQQAQTGQQQNQQGQQAQQQAQSGQQQTGEQQTGEQQQVTEAQQPAAEHPLTAMPASEVIGTEVVNAEGDQVAEIVDLVKEQGQGEVMAVLSVGGFLGVGDKQVVLSLSELDVAPDNQIIAAGMTEEDVKAMPDYDKARYESTLEQTPASAPATGQPAPQQ